MYFLLPLAQKKTLGLLLKLNLQAKNGSSYYPWGPFPNIQKCLCFRTIEMEEHLKISVTEIMLSLAKEVL